MVSCCVSGCDTTRRNNPDNCTFHRFPLDKISKRQWLKLIGRPGWIPKKYSTVCSKHFPDSHKRKRSVHTILLPGATPTLFLPCSPKTKSKAVSKRKEKTPSTDEEDFSITSKTLWPSDKFKPKQELSSAESEDDVIKCCVPFCEEANGFQSETQNFTFVEFPTAKRLRKSWLDAIGLDEEELPRRAVVCSQHFHKEDFTVTDRGTLSLNKCVPSAAPVQFCLVCLDTASKLHPMSEQLKKAYGHLTGLSEFSVMREINIEPRACWECSRRLLNAELLRDKSLRAHKLLLTLLEMHKKITLKNIRKVQRDNCRLTSNLVKHTVAPDRYDLCVKDGIEIEIDRCDTKQDVHKHVDYILSDYVQNIKEEKDIIHAEAIAYDNKCNDVADSEIKDIELENSDPLDVKSEDETFCPSDDEAEYLDENEMMSDDKDDIDSPGNDAPNDTDEVNHFENYLKFVNENIRSEGSFDDTYARNEDLIKGKLKNNRSGKNKVSLSNLILVKTKSHKLMNEEKNNDELSEELIKSDKNDKNVSSVILVRESIQPILNENIISTKNTTIIDKSSENRVKYTNKNVKNIPKTSVAKITELKQSNEHIPKTSRNGMELKQSNRNIPNTSSNRVELSQKNTDILKTFSTNKTELKHYSVKGMRVIKISGTTNPRRQATRAMEPKSQNDLMTQITGSATEQELSEIDKRMELSIARRHHNTNMFEITKLTKEEQIEKLQKRKETTVYKNSLFKCELCYKGFINSQAFAEHMEVHTEKYGSVQCEICKVYLKSPTHVAYHITWNHTYEYKCTRCAYTTMYSKSALSHQRWHEGKRYQCQFCGTVFSHPASYHAHVRVKHPSNHACALCGLSFSGEMGLFHQQLKKHRFESTENLPGPECKDCRVRFASDDAYKRHMLVSPMHGNMMRNEIRKKVYRPKHTEKVLQKTVVECEQCGVKLPTLRSYMHHLEKRHPDKSGTVLPSARAVMCDQCGDVLKDKMILNFHMSMHSEANLLTREQAASHQARPNSPPEAAEDDSATLLLVTTQEDASLFEYATGETSTTDHEDTEL